MTSRTSPLLALLLLLAPASHGLAGFCSGPRAGEVGAGLDGAWWAHGPTEVRWRWQGATPWEVPGHPKGEPTVTVRLHRPSDLPGAYPVVLGSAPASRGALLVDAAGLADRRGYEALIEADCGVGERVAFGVDHAPPELRVEGHADGWLAVGARELRAVATDRLSGVAGAGLAFEGADPGEPAGATLVVAGDGVHRVRAWAEDRLGHRVERALEVRLDATPPTSRLAFDGGELAAHAADLQVVAEDATSGPARLRAALGEAALADQAGWTLRLEGAGLHRLRWQALDAAGNAEPVQEAWVRLARPVGDASAPSEGADAGAGAGVDPSPAAEDAAPGPPPSSEEDFVAPEVTVKAGGPQGDAGWFLGPVEVDVRSDDAAALLEARVGDGPWAPAEGPLRLAAEGVHTVQARATDPAGNVGTAALEVPIDLAAPTLALAPSAPLRAGWSARAFQVLGEAADAGSGVRAAEVRLDGGPWQPLAGPLEVAGEGRHRVELRAWDRAGRVAVAGLDAGIDSSAPTLAVTVQGPQAPDWSAGASVLRASASDAGSGVAELRYRVDEGPWKAYRDRVLVNAEGRHVVEFLARDLVGHEARAARTVQVDQRPPSLAITSPEPGRSYRADQPDGYLMYPGTQAWLKGGHTVRAEASDGASAVRYVIFAVNGEQRHVDREAPYEWHWPAPHLAGKHKLTVTAYDLAGWRTVREMTVFLSP